MILDSLDQLVSYEDSNMTIDFHGDESTSFLNDSIETIDVIVTDKFGKQSEFSQVIVFLSAETEEVSVDDDESADQLQVECEIISFSKNLISIEYQIGSGISVTHLPDLIE